MQRRDLLKAAALGAAQALLPAALPAEPPIPILDAHIHLFDPTRPGGVPWPTPDDKALYRPALPPRYEALSAKYGVVGAIAIEASSLNSDNDWLLQVVKQHPFMVGMVGDLVPGSPTFEADLDRLHRDPLFLGIRYGNLWDRDLLADLDKPRFVPGLKALAASGLVFESANPDGRLISAIRTAAERVPDLRIVIDHLPNAKLPEAKAGFDAFWADLHALSQRPGVFVKLSEIITRKDGKLVTDVAFYRAHLDRLWDLFGGDRVLFGSDWPNSDHVATYDETLSLVRSYMAQKSRSAQERYYGRNSLAAYHWRARRPSQRLGL